MSTHKKISEPKGLKRFPKNAYILIVDPEIQEPKDKNQRYTGFLNALQNIQDHAKTSIQAQFKDTLQWADLPEHPEAQGNPGDLAYDSRLHLPMHGT